MNPDRLELVLSAALAAPFLVFFAVLGDQPGTGLVLAYLLVRTARGWPA